MTSEVRLRTLSRFQQAVLLLALPLSTLATVFPPVAMWEKASAFFAQGDIARFYLNRICAVAVALFGLFWFLVSLHLLSKEVTVSSDGIRFSGLLRVVLPWEAIRDMKVEVTQHSTTLLLWSTNGRRFEIGIGDRPTADVCEEILHAFNEKRGRPNKSPEPTPTAVTPRADKGKAK